MQVENPKINRWIDLLSGSEQTDKNKKLKEYLSHLASKPRRQRVSVNLFKLDKMLKANESVVVPGKVLGSGELKKSINITAIDFSTSALAKLKAANCKVVKLEDMVAKGGARIII